MKKLLTLTLVLVLTGCSVYNENGNEPMAQMEVQMQKNNIRIEETPQSTTEVTEAQTTIDPRIEQVNEGGWYEYDIKDVEILVSEKEFLNVTEVNINPEYQSLLVFYKGTDENRSGIGFSPTEAKITDEFGNLGKFTSYGDREVSASQLDLTSKTYTIELEFDDNPEVGDVTITITLP